MRAMNRRRLVGWLALLAMAWAALLPFTASARMLFSDGPVEHCHRLSIDSVIDTDPVAPEGPSQPRKATCPFCASAAFAVPPPTIPLPVFVFRDLGAAAPSLYPPDFSGNAVALPPSRAPPAILPAR
jgi:hypothetical protein